MKKLNPVGHRVMVRPSKIEEEQLLDDDLPGLKSKGFIINKPDGQHRRDAAGTDSGVVVAVGPSAWKLAQYGYGDEGWTPWAKVGDRVVFGRYAGKLLKDPETGEEDVFMIINDDDIQAVITEEGECL
jgi:co-chaperonin GroES (HSP10)